MTDSLPNKPFTTRVRMRWSTLCFFHWRIDPAEIAKRLPPELEPDLYDGSAWIAIVPFELSRMRFAPFPAVPGLRQFPELNLRTYVRHADGRSGVWFFSLEADHGVAVTVARTIFHLNYVETSIVVNRDADGTVDFRALRRHPEAGQTLTTLRYRYRAAEAAPFAAEPGSLEAFLVERYRFFGYKKSSDQLYEGLVRHAPYQLCHVEAPVCDADLFRWNGLERPGRPPDHILAALPVEVEGSAPRKA